MYAGRLWAGVLALSMAGCGLTSPRDTLATFDFAEVTNQQVQAAMDAQGAGRQVLFAGQTPTPTRCYNLTADLSTSSQTITVTISARAKNESCAATPGSFRYTGSVEMAHAGTYHFTIKHVFPAGTLPMTTFTEDVVLQ